MVRQTWATCLVVAAIALSGCGTQSTVTRTPGDPFERMNRRIFAFNNALDRSVSKPVARTYKVVTPQFVRTGISNFVGNLSYPAVIMNDVLPLKGMPRCVTPAGFWSTPQWAWRVFSILPPPSA